MSTCKALTLLNLEVMTNIQIYLKITLVTGQVHSTLYNSAENTQHTIFLNGKDVYFNENV